MFRQCTRETLRKWGRAKLPFAECSVAYPPSRRHAKAGRSLRSSGTTDDVSYARLVSCDPRHQTPGTKYAGGHRIRVTPVPIPNTEVKPDTADGTAWETVWESRSLPAVIVKPDVERRRAFVFLAAANSAHTVSHAPPSAGTAGERPTAASSKQSHCMGNRVGE